MIFNSKECQNAKYLFETFLRHVWNLLDLCYSEKQTLILSNIITSLRILIFETLQLQDKVIAHIVICKGWPTYSEYYFEDKLLCFEKLELLFYRQKTNTNFYLLRRRKIIELCQQIRWSINEGEEYVRLEKDTKYMPLIICKLLKIRRKVFCCLRKEQKWQQIYLKQLKSYKFNAVSISIMLKCSKIFFDKNPHEKFLHELKNSLL